MPKRCEYCDCPDHLAEGGDGGCECDCHPLNRQVVHHCPSCDEQHQCQKPDACMCQFPDAVRDDGVRCESCDMATGDNIDLRKVYE